MGGFANVPRGTLTLNPPGVTPGEATALWDTKAFHGRDAGRKHLYPWRDAPSRSAWGLVGNPREEQGLAHPHQGGILGGRHTKKCGGKRECKAVLTGDPQ